MRAERFHGSRIRSQSSRNKTERKRYSSKSPATPGFFFLACTALQSAGCWCARNFTGAMLEARLMKFAKTQADLLRLDTRPCFANSNHLRAGALQSVSGLPCSDDQKNGDALTTYRHSGERSLKNAFTPMPYVNDLWILSGRSWNHNGASRFRKNAQIHKTYRSLRNASPLF